MLTRCLAFVFAALATTACGHPATEAECAEIVERIARLEYEKEQAPPSDIRRGVDEIKKDVRESMMKDCVGKRITDSAMRCVRNATESQEIVDECFD